MGWCCLGKVEELMLGDAAEVLDPGLPQLPPATSKSPPSFIASLLLFSFCGDGSNQYSIRTAAGKPIYVWEAGWKEPLWYNPIILLVSAVLGIWRFCIASDSLLPTSMQTKQDPRELVLLMALKIMLHAKLRLFVIKFLIRVCRHPERICRALSSWGQRGQVRLSECLNHTACFWLYRVPDLYFIIMHMVLTGT